MTDGSKRPGMSVRLSKGVTEEVERMAARFGCSPVEVVRLGLGVLKIAFDELENGLTLAIVTDRGEPLRTIELPRLADTEQGVIDSTIRSTIESIHPSSLLRSIQDLDPDNPPKDKDQGPIR